MAVPTFMLVRRAVSGSTVSILISTAVAVCGSGFVSLSREVWLFLYGVPLYES